MRSSVIDLAAGVFSLLCAAVFYFQSGKLTGAGRDYPMGLIIFISLGGLFLLIQGICKRWSGNDPIAAKVEPTSYRRVIFITVVSVVYVLLIDLLGFYTTSAVFLVGTAMVLNDAGWSRKKNAMVACVFAVIMCFSIWFGFGKLLSVPTPEGRLF